LHAEDPPAKLIQPVTHDIRRITTPEGVEDVLKVETQVWPEDFDWLRHRLTTLLRENPEQVSIYVAYVDNLPVSAGWTRFPSKGHFASLWGGSTLEAYRGRGLFTALVAVRLQEARQRGFHFLTVDASPMSRPILEKLGFQLMALSYPCQWSIKREHAEGQA
jgi:GNAT superfamily N-acetyltransferase